MFKKSLLALAMAGAAVSAQAVTTVSTDADATTVAIDAAAAGAGEAFLVSAQGAVGASSFNFGGGNLGLNVTIDDAADKGYDSLEVVKITFTNGVVHPNSSPTITIYDEDGDDVTNDSTAGANTADIGNAADSYEGSSTIVMTFDAADRTQFALLSTNNAGNFDGFNFVIDGLAINTLDAGQQVSATVEFISEIGESVLDTASTDFAAVINQFSVEVTDSLTDQLNVGVGRTRFVNGTGATAADKLAQNLVVTVTSEAVDLLPATSTGVTTPNGDHVVTTVSGDFSFVDADADGTVDTGFTATGYQENGTLRLEDTNPGFDGTGNTSTATFNIGTNGDVVLPTGAFNYEVGFLYDNAAIADGSYTASGSAGAWTLNGAEANIPFMPFNNAFSQSVTIANTGSVSGAITIDWTFNGETITTELTAVAAAESVTDISAELREIAAANGITGNAALKVVVNSPDSDIGVKALYYSKADADRGIVL